MKLPIDSRPARALGLALLALALESCGGAAPADPLASEVAAHFPDRGAANAQVLRQAKRDVFYECHIGEQTPMLGQVELTRTLARDGGFAGTVATWDFTEADSEKLGGQKFADQLRLRAIWRRDDQELRLAAGDFMAAWDLYPAVGGPGRVPEPYYVDRDGKRLALTSTWPAKYDTPRRIDSWIAWRDLSAAIDRSRQVWLVVGPRGAPPVRRYVISHLIPVVAATVERLDALAKAAAKDWTRRCEAREAVVIVE